MSSASSSFSDAAAAAAASRSGGGSARGGGRVAAAAAAMRGLAAAVELRARLEVVEAAGDEARHGGSAGAIAGARAERVGCSSCPRPARRTRALERTPTTLLSLSIYMDR